jgi:CheY-like chemotaxis protein
VCRVNLEFEGYAVIEASDGEQALEQVARHRPDAVLLDVMMPKMDGWQVLEALKTDDDLKDIPVVMLTAQGPGPGPDPRLVARAADYITKPFSPLALSQVLQDVLATDPEEEARRRQMILEKLQLLQNS